MAIIEIVNVSTPNDGLGDPLRASQVKANNNATELNEKKVEKVPGMDLSQNNFTDTEKEKLAGLAADAQKNVQANWNQNDPTQDDYIIGKPENSIIITNGTYSLVGQNLTLFAGWFWQINGITYTNTVDIIINYPFASAGMKRLDRTVFNTLNSAERFEGVENATNPIAPPTTDDTVTFSISLITDDKVGDPSLPITNESYVEKMESVDVIINYGATTVIDQINLVDNKSSISLTNAVTDIKSVQVSGEFLRPGKPHFVKNRTNHPVTIWHLAGTGNVKYFFPNATNLVIKPYEVVEFNLNGNDSSTYRFEVVGTPVDLTDYYNKTEVNTLLLSKGDMTTNTAQTVSGVKTFLAGMFGLRNTANTFTSFFASAVTASRTWTLQDRNGILADDTDLALKQNIALNVQTVASSATVTPTSSNDLVLITAQAVNLTLANPTGTFQQGQSLIIRIKDNGTSRTIAFGTNYRIIGSVLPTVTIISKTMYIGIIYNSTDTKWDVVAIKTEN